MINRYETEFSPEFTNRVINCYNRMKFIGVIIMGSFGQGKTSGAMQLGLDIVNRFYPNKTEDELEEIVLNHMLFTMDEVSNALFKEIKKVNWDNLSPLDAIKKQKYIREPFFIWEDAATHGSKHLRNEEVAYEIQKNFDQVRDATSCMIITLPEAEEILKVIRTYRSFFRAEPVIQKNNRYMQLVFFKKKRLYSGSLRWTPSWYSNQRPIRVDDDWYGKYIIMRNKAKIKTDEFWEQKKKFKQQHEEYLRVKREYLKKKMLNEMNEMIGGNNEVDIVE